MANHSPLQRHAENPILTVSDFRPSHPDLKIIGAFNPGACTFNHEILLLVRVAETCEQEKDWVRVPVFTRKDEGFQIEIKSWKLGKHKIDISDPRKFLIDGKMYLSSISHLQLARGKDGVKFQVDARPVLMPRTALEQYGIEDVRITQIGKIYYLTFTAVSENGHGVNLVSTSDWRTFTRHGMILPPQNKDACLFPAKIDNQYYMLHRPNPEAFGKPSIWLASSPDLQHWGQHACIQQPLTTSWEQQKIGAGPQPIKTPQGWLLLYHACGKDDVYTLSTSLLDLHDPRRIVKQRQTPIFMPETDYEKRGFFGNVVFSNGWVAEPDGRLLIYYGAADESVCVAETTVETLMNLFPAVGK